MIEVSENKQGEEIHLSGMLYQMVNTFLLIYKLVNELVTCSMTIVYHHCFFVHVNLVCLLFWVFLYVIYLFVNLLV